MADNVELNSGSGGATLATDDIAGVQHQRVKLQYGVDGSATDVSDTNPLPIDDAGGSLTVDGTVTANAGTGTFTVDASGTAVPVTDNSGSLTVDNAALSVTGGGVEASALRVTLANDSTGVVSVDDNGGSLTVDGTVTVQDGGSTISIDDGAGSLTVDGTVTANAGTGTFTVDQTDDEARLNGVSRKDIDPSDGTTQLTTKFASVDVATSGDNTIVSAVASKKIRVLSVVLVASAATTVTWKSATAGAISGGMQLASNGGYSLSSDYGLFETTAGEALVLNLSGANSIDGHISYVEV